MEWKLFSRKQKIKYRVETETDFDSRKLITEVIVISNATGIPVKVKGLWDTGARMTTLSQSLIEMLGIPQDTTKSFGVQTTHGIKWSRAYTPTFLFGEEEITISALATDQTLANGCSVLIGMDIISKGDLSITNVDGKMEMIFRIPPMGHIKK